MVELYTSEFCKECNSMDAVLNRLYKGKINRKSIHSPEGMIALGKLMLDKKASGDRIPVLVDEEGMVYEGMKGVLDFMETQKAINYDGVASVVKWMNVAGQGDSQKDAQLYLKLIDEESKEMAAEKEHTVEHFKELLDTIWVMIGYGHALGYPMAQGFRELSLENFSKFVKVDGEYQAIRRDDGKILKPATFRKGDYAGIFYA